MFLADFDFGGAAGTGCVLIKDIGRRHPLALQCRLHQGQQSDVNQSVRGIYKTPISHVFIPYDCPSQLV